MNQTGDRTKRVVDLEAGETVPARSTPQEQLREQLLFQSQLLDSVRESLIATDLDGRVKYWGKGAQALYGYRADEVLGRLITMIVRPHEAAEEIDRMRHARETGSWRGEYRQLRKDGSSFWADTLISLVTDESGEPCGFIGIDRDITDRRGAQDKAQQLHAQLAHVARVSTLGEMAAGLAHELSQPMTVILSNARGCLEAITEGTDPQALVGRLRSSAAAAERSAAIIQRLWSLVSKGQSQRSTVDLNELVNEILVLIGSELRQHDVRMRCDLADGLPPVEVDRIQIQQVLLNLIRNACEAMHDSCPEARRVTISTALNAAGQVRVTVCDGGPGIPDDGIEQVFESFFTTKPKGLGMGLTISRSIIEAHGGRLTAERAEGGGASIAFTLPHRQPEADLISQP